MVATFVPQSKRPSSTTRARERTSYLREHRQLIEDAMTTYFADNPHGEQVTLAVLRALGPTRLKAAARRVRTLDTVKQDVGLLVPIVLCELVGDENVETYRDPNSGRSSARAIPAAWADLQALLSRYTPHRLTPAGLHRLSARGSKARSKELTR